MNEKECLEIIEQLVKKFVVDIISTIAFHEIGGGSVQEGLKRANVYLNRIQSEVNAQLAQKNN